MDDWASIAARQAREMEEAQQRGHEQAVHNVMQMGVSRELAQYLVGLEVRITQLEREK